MILSLVVQFEWELEQMDIKIAILQGDLEETIFMKQPEGFEDKRGKDLVCKLKKSLYGLKQSPRQWNKKFDSFVRGIGFNKSYYDVCLYYEGNNSEDIIILLIYVDDMLIACKSLAKAVNLKKQLSIAFDMTDLGSASKILRMAIERDKHRKTLKITQNTYLEKLVDKFGMKNAKPTRIPLAGHFKLSVNLEPVNEEERRYMKRVPYSSAIGSVMFSMVTSKPDLSYSISVLSRFMSDPKKEH